MGVEPSSPDFPSVLGLIVELGAILLPKQARGHPFVYTLRCRDMHGLGLKREFPPASGIYAEERVFVVNLLMIRVPLNAMKFNLLCSKIKYFLQ